MLPTVSLPIEAERLYVQPFSCRCPEDATELHEQVTRSGLQRERFSCIKPGPEAPRKIASVTGKGGGTEMTSRNAKVITLVASLAISGGMALTAQDKYTLQVPGGGSRSPNSGATRIGRLSPSVRLKR